MTKVLVSAEVQEELDEILQMLDGHGYEVTVVAPAPLLQNLSAADIVTREAPAAEFGNVRAKLRGILHFVFEVRRARPDVVVSGFSMLRHRIASAVHRIPHVSYIRGLMFDAGIRSGFSDRLETGITGKVLRSRVFRSYESDAIVTVSEINVSFLRDRHIDVDKVTLSGPVWLKDMSVGTGAGRIILCTTGLDSHGHHEQQLKQVASLHAVARAVDQEVILRIHPRDRYDYGNDPRYAWMPIDRQKPAEFLRTLRHKDVLVSRPSTLVYEAGYLGVRSVLFRIEESLQSDEALETHGIVVHDIERIPQLVEAESRIFDAFAPIDMEALHTTIGDLLGART